MSAAHQLDPNNVIRSDEVGLDLDAHRVTAQRLLNSAVRGRVEVDFDTRTVVFGDLTGDQALRMCALVKEWNPDDPSSRRWSDQSDPRLAEATDGLIVFRPGRVLSIRWFPERHVFESDDHCAALSAALEILQWPDGSAAATGMQEVVESDSAAEEEITDDDDDDTEASAPQPARGGTSPAPPATPG